jgi:putative transposase
MEYHFVWVTKYRYKVLRGEVVERLRERVRETCEAFEIRIVKRLDELRGDELDGVSHRA